MTVIFSFQQLSLPCIYFNSLQVIPEKGSIVRFSKNTHYIYGAAPGSCLEDDVNNLMAKLFWEVQSVTYEEISAEEWAAVVEIKRVIPGKN